MHQDQVSIYISHFLCDLCTLSKYCYPKRIIAFVGVNSWAGPLEGMRDFVHDFHYLAEGLCWYSLEAFDFIADKFLTLCLVFASLLEDLVEFYFCKILIV
ncbi:hypothetical protein RIF29_25509 [Crotalaria pallida]|uniref:Uncharacterized protein n=1 Tax=Crotalaria pallida TaxID=3830 RepID=A0AAN9EMK8_CROPI